MEQRIRDKINAAIDKALIEFQSNPDFIFDNERERLKFQYSRPKALKYWKKKQICIVDGCNKKSIEKSHTIQKSSSIKELAENSHVLTPNFNLKNGKMEMLTVGVNEASTFPGYCSDHENLFREFENQKDFNTGEHIGLQLYRTVCREIVIGEHHIAAIKDDIKRYLKFRNKMMRDAIISNLDNEVLNNPNLKFNDINVESEDYRLKLAKKQLNKINNNLNKFLYTYRDDILNDLKKKKFQKIACVAIAFNEQIPIALAGKGNFYFNNKVIYVVINILPYVNTTYIFFSTLQKHNNALKSFMTQFENPLKMMSVIENCLIYGSDHWFIKPSIWNRIEKDKQQKILDSILDENHCIADDFNLTILNDLKIKYFNLAEEQDIIPSDVAKLIAEEKNRLTIKKTSI